MLLVLLPWTQALVVQIAETEILFPGSVGNITIEIENIFNEDIKDVTLKLDFTGLPLIPVGSSQEFFEEIQEDDEEDFVFTIKAANDATPGDYQIPYIVTYVLEDEQKTNNGTIGITINADIKIEFSVFQENQIINKEGTITLTLVNKGFADAKFVSVKVFPEGYTLLSEDTVYIGKIDSDDFETTTFRVFYQEDDPVFNARIEYSDFNNQKKIETVSLPLKIYTVEEATKLGLIEENKTGLYIGIVLTLILAGILYRVIRKQRRKQRRLSENTR